MYVQHSVHIDRSVDHCVELLQRGPRTWFPRLRGDGKSDVGLRVAGVTIRKRVAVQLGEPEDRGQWTNVPVSWISCRYVSSRGRISRSKSTFGAAQASGASIHSREWREGRIEIILAISYRLDGLRRIAI